MNLDLRINGFNLKEAIEEAVTRAISNSQTSESKSEETKLLTRKEAAEILSISLPTLNTYTKKGKLKAYKIGRSVRYKEEELMEALKSVKKFGSQ